MVCGKGAGPGASAMVPCTATHDASAMAMNSANGLRFVAVTSVLTGKRSLFSAAMATLRSSNGTDNNGFVVAEEALETWVGKALNEMMNEKNKKEKDNGAVQSQEKAAAFLNGLGVKSSAQARGPFG